MAILESVLNRNITLNQLQNQCFSYKSNTLLQLHFQLIFFLKSAFC